MEQERELLLKTIDQQKEEIARLGTDIKVLRASASKDTATEALVKENERMKLTLAEMKRFLAEQGLDWIGNEVKKRDTFSDGVEEEIDFSALMLGLERVNDNVGTQRACLSDARNGHFAEIESVPLTIYKDGIFLWRGPFRPFSEKSKFASKFVRECVAGFVPQEFRARYPNGVRFEVTDRRDTLFAKRGSEPRSFGASKMTKLQFLRRLPRKTVLSSGRVLDLRSKFSKPAGHEREAPRRTDEQKKGASNLESRKERRALITAALDRRLNARECRN